MYQNVNDYDRLANSGVLLELQMWLEQFADQQEITAEMGDTMYTGTLTKLTCANGMVYAVPNGNTNDAVQYQLQIQAQYEIEN